MPTLHFFPASYEAGPLSSSGFYAGRCSRPPEHKGGLPLHSFWSPYNRRRIGMNLLGKEYQIDVLASSLPSKEVLNLALDKALTNMLRHSCLSSI